MGWVSSDANPTLFFMERVIADRLGFYFLMLMLQRLFLTQILRQMAGTNVP